MLGQWVLRLTLKTPLSSATPLTDCTYSCCGLFAGGTFLGLHLFNFSVCDSGAVCMDPILAGSRWLPWAALGLPVSLHVKTKFFSLPIHYPHKTRISKNSFFQYSYSFPSQNMFSRKKYFFLSSQLNRTMCPTCTTWVQRGCSWLHVCSENSFVHTDSHLNLCAPSH